MIIRTRLLYKITLCLIAIAVIIIILSNYKHGTRYHDEFLSLDTVGWIEDELSHESLVDLADFRYKIDNDLCKKFGKDLLGVIIVTSYVGHDELRAAHRQAISQNKLIEMGFLRVFLLAEIPAREKYIKQLQISDENRRFGDLIQGNFVEAYRNLTYKHIMGLKWAATKCHRAKFIVKIDDDVVFDVFHLKNYLESLEIEGFPRSFLAGYILENKVPVRLAESKWSVTLEEYPGELYPDYLSGWLYITNPNTAQQLVQKSHTEKFFWIDDTWITGVLRDLLGIPIVKLNSWFSSNAEFLDCCVRDLKDSAYECEYFVGPNGGDSKLIVEFLHEIEKCYFDECNKRSPEHSLRQTCVASAKHLVPDHGDALVREVKL